MKEKKICPYTKVKQAGEEVKTTKTHVMQAIKEVKNNKSSCEVGRKKEVKRNTCVDF